MGSLGKSKKKKKKKKTKKKKKKKKPATLKTQKDGLGKNQGQRKEKRGKSHQVENLRMQPKKRRILQDESLEV